MSKAFLSHSSFDKDFVGEVFSKLGAAKAVYDQVTFERNCDLPAQIENGIYNSKIYVLFLSKEALNSGWVKSEIDLAHELKAKWEVNEFLVFQLDATPWSELPSWLSKFVVACPPAPDHVALKILDRLRVKEDSSISCHGRADEVKDATISILGRDTPPSFIYVSGPAGIGRKTFLSAVYESLYPEIAAHKIHITLDPSDDINSIYRKILAYSSNWRTRDLYDATQAYLALEPEEKIIKLARKVSQISVGFRQVVVFDIGISALDDNGRPLEWFSKLLDVLPDADYPYVWFVSQRYLVERDFGNGLIVGVPPLSEENSAYLFKLLIHKNKISFPDKKEKEYIENSIVGHPGLITQVVKYLKVNPQYKPNRTYSQIVKLIAQQIENLLKDFINGDPQKEKAVAFFSESYVLSYEEIVKVSEVWPEFESAVDSLMDAGFLYHINGDYQLVTYLQRYSHTLSAQHYKDLTIPRSILLQTFDSITEDAFIPAQLLDARIVSYLNTGEQPTGFLKNLIMPAQQLKAARRKYDEKRYDISLNLALNAYEQSHKLSETGLLESWRLIGLSAIRENDAERFKYFEAQYPLINASGRRNAIYQFAQGFKCRNLGDLRAAEDWFSKIEAQGLADAHVYRELAYIYAFEGSHDKALDRVARALRLAPTNPYILDIQAFALLEKYKKKKTPALLDEVENCLRQLREASEDTIPGFYLIRQCVLDILINGDQSSLSAIFNDRHRLPIHAKITLLRLLSIKGKTVQFEQLKIELAKIVRDSQNKLAGIEFERVQIEHYGISENSEARKLAKEKLARYRNKLTQVCVDELEDLLRHGEAGK